MRTAAHKKIFACLFQQQFLILINKTRAQTMAGIGYFWLDNSPFAGNTKKTFRLLMDQIDRPNAIIAAE